ncbi:1-phosphatidylinositol phosphodiesterase-like [Xyrauchen texanus]|uniref:1-phosphatidylinositol phosphodiesterase-like n=1 Tax=Xyrauchen texanus TaxID=154827 RepID=UPI002242B2E5|nr:1-phosphatidylinositol phosphodiesterase-like [Xyrauchen texanus]
MKMTATGTILFILTLLLHKNSGQEAFNEKKTVKIPETYTVSWMQSLDDGKSISTITIPGTHESMAFHGLAGAKSQALSLEEQLKAGIRYVEFTVSGKRMDIKNGKTTLDDALRKIKSFLTQFKSETVLVRVGSNDKKINVQDLVENLVEKDTNVWVQKSIPKIGDVRGKIVFVQKDSFKMGIPLMEITTKGDHKVSNSKEKRVKIRDHLSEAFKECAKEGGESSVVLTYSSDTYLKKHILNFISTSKKMAKDVNPWLYGYLKKASEENPKPCYGIIAMDYPGFDLIQMVINFNT